MFVKLHLATSKHTPLNNRHYFLPSKAGSRRSALHQIGTSQEAGEGLQNCEMNAVLGPPLAPSVKILLFPMLLECICVGISKHGLGLDRLTCLSIEERQNRKGPDSCSDRESDLFESLVIRKDRIQFTE